MLPVSGAEQLKTSRRPRHAAHDLGQRRVVAVRQAEAATALLRALAARGRRQEQVPQSHRARPGLELFDRLHGVQRLPALVWATTAGLDVAVRVTPKVAILTVGRAHFLVDDDCEPDGVVRRGVSSVVLRAGAGVQFRF